MKNKILRASVYMATIVAAVSGCMIDSATNIPFVVFAMSITYLNLFIHANVRPKITISVYTDDYK